MQDFLERVKIAVKEFRKLKSCLASKENSFGLGLKLRDLDKSYEILDSVFIDNIEPDSHLVNYFKFMMREKELNVNLCFPEHWVYRSAIVSLSKYFNPSLDTLLSQHYSSAFEFIIENLGGLRLDINYDTDVIIKAVKPIKGKTYSSVSYIGADAQIIKCKELLDKSIELIITKLKKIQKIKIYEAIDLFSFSILEVIISRLDTLP